MDAADHPKNPRTKRDTMAHHLEVLREMLRRDYLSKADWSYALRDLAEMAREALQAAEGFVAIFQEEETAWSAFTSRGGRLTNDQISRHGSRSILERVRRTEKPLLTTEDDPLDYTSESIRMHRVESVLAVPIYWWDVTEDKPERHFGGCLYVHRTLEHDLFNQNDVELMLDIASLAQRTLNVLRHLRDVKTALAASQERLRGLQESMGQTHRLGTYETQDRWFGENVLATLQRVAHADKVGLLIVGPTGSGKTYLAEAYHYECPRKEGPFVVLDCAQVTSEQTLAAELFGYAPRSGFANAPPAGRLGAAQLAHQGTLFIDEIATLPAELQQRLLTLIQTGTFSPLGSSEKKVVDIQVLAATNENLEQLVHEKRFREDLFWRLSVVTVRLPSLSQRKADVSVLARKFLDHCSKQFGRRDVQEISVEALRSLEEHDWAHAGNIRGLEHTIYRSVLLAKPGARTLHSDDLHFQTLSVPFGRGGVATGMPSHATSRAAGSRRQGGRSSQKLEAIKDAIREHGFATSAARALGISHGAVVWQLRKAGLTVRDVLADSDGS